MPEVKTQCASCKKTIRAPEKFAGRSAHCPRCKSPITFPDTNQREPTPPHQPPPNTAPSLSGSHLPGIDLPGIDFPLPIPPVPLGASPQLPSAPSQTPATPTAPIASSPAPVAPVAPVPIVLPPEEEFADNIGLVPIAPGEAQPATQHMPPPPVEPATQPLQSAPVNPVNPVNPGGPPQIQIDVTGAASPNTAPLPNPLEAPTSEPADANPFHIDTGGGAPTASSASAPHDANTSADQNVGDASGGQGYSPILRLKGSKKSMAARQIDKALGKRGKVTSCKLYKIGPAKSFWDRVHTLGVFPQEFEMEADEVHVITASDRAGEFRVVMPFDKGVFCPVEYVSLMSGTLPTSLGLMRGKGGNWGLRVTNTAAGSLLHPTMQSILSAAGGQADAVWTVLDANDPSNASDGLNQDRDLNAKLRFDSRLKMGMMEVTYQLDWLAQALPIGPEHYLLVARYIPRNKTMSIEFGVDWFLKWRDQFHRKTKSLPPGNGLFCPFEHGLWSAVTHELMGIHVL